MVWDSLWEGRRMRDLDADNVEFSLDKESGVELGSLEINKWSNNYSDVLSKS